MKAVYIQIRGRVQGVGLRYSAWQEARRLGLQGWIRNEGDGSVLALVQGESAHVDQFLVWMRKGPSGAVVHGVEIKPHDIDQTLLPFMIMRED